MKIVIAAAVLLATSAGAGAQIYTQDFSSDQNGFTGGIYATTPSGEKYLELAQGSGSTATLAVATPGYTGRTLTFNLYGIQSVDGNGPDGGGPDNFLIYLNGAATPAYDINIANYFSGSNTQSYNGDLSASGVGQSYAPFTGALARGTLGYGTGPYGDSTYAVSFGIGDDVTSITFVGALSEDPGNESYGIDNVSLTGTRVVNGAVPEPASWAMMIGGFSLAGGAIRRRRAGMLATD